MLQGIKKAGKYETAAGSTVTTGAAQINRLHMILIEFIK
jgi:hypothetical protein